MNIKRHELTARYAQAVTHDNTVYLAGQIADDWDKDITGQANEIFARIDILLAKAGTDKKKLLTMTCWINDFSNYTGFNQAYDAWIDAENLPARATVRAELLDPKLHIEIMLTAAK
ncbi:hypothetical protein MNBD_ALPHA03-481 [hydrothermal vent metagenome]|uniref:RidA/YER057c/UK114 superfamily, group 2, YoaB-like protein n=1 Tax=hydrothermal vent metagenome TaxID=652676 RepID=A0A3B1ARA2_9ZZZZ